MDMDTTRTECIFPEMSYNTEHELNNPIRELQSVAEQSRIFERYSIIPG